MKNNNNRNKPKNMAYPVCLKSSWSFLYQNLPKPLLDAFRMRERQKYANLHWEVLCAWTKDMKQKKFPKDNMASAKLQANRSSEPGHPL